MARLKENRTRNLDRKPSLTCVFDVRLPKVQLDQRSFRAWRKIDVDEYKSLRLLSESQEG